MKYLTLIAFLITSPVFAETLISPSEFEALTTDKTLYFSKDGVTYGAERFYKGRRSKWRYSNGECADGEWFVQNNLYCFNYENGVETQCWEFFKTDEGGYAARAYGAPLDQFLKLEAIDDKPLLCVDPGLAA